jgi:hypothetical protein
VNAYELKIRPSRPFGWYGEVILLGESYGGLDLILRAPGWWRLTRTGLEKKLRRVVQNELAAEARESATEEVPF